MSEYHKINSLFMRDPATKNKRFILGQYADPAFEYLKDALWDGTEKIDGTNIRVTWDGAAVTFGGKTDNAQIPAKLVTVLQEMFKPELLLRVLGEKGGVTLYGEGYGSGIQTGGNYRPDQSLILFDIAVGGVFWERLKVQDTAKALGILFVPVLGTETLAGWLDIARNGFKSNLNLHAQAEGVVLRPVVELRTRLGARVITKLKHKDFV